ncbi:MAG: cryptochrome/photolyase family protein [Chitinophagaceae bacterium]|nr:cryptochrome/photolyase family protein [Chitinophagaceae bacterium]
MSAVTIIFPHQLYPDHPAIDKSRKIILVEEWLFFRQYNFHKQKLVLHRASMKNFEYQLKLKKISAEYIETQDERNDIRVLVRELAEKRISIIHYVDTTDNWLEKRLSTTAKKYNIQLVKYTNPNFLNQSENLADFFSKKKTYFQTDFYVAQRKQRKILLEKDDKPIGGKWTYDADNRLKLPKNEKIPVISFPKENKWVKEAKKYTATHFPDNYGSVEKFIYPINSEESEIWLQEFLQTRFCKFGIYEDAMIANEHFLFHSVLTPMLNIGLLYPQQIIDKAIDAAIEYDVPLNSLEGFIRQILGWREFIRIVYEREGTLQRTKNYWGFTRKIPASFWKGNTGIEPVDVIIKKTLTTGYSHHIERLMVLGNFMLLCEFHPDEVYGWFMEMYIDSYDWVMVPNVYGMTQFADGGLMTTKPYMSGSNYLLKMGDWGKGDWQQTWDGLFWRFMHVHRNFFLKNPRLGMLVHTFDKMTEEKKKTHLNNADQFLKRLDNETKQKSRT